MFIVPDSKRCAKLYGEGPEANQDRCEDCDSFYMEERTRCCKQSPWSERDLYTMGKLVLSKYIDDDVVCCGGFQKKEGK